MHNELKRGKKVHFDITIHCLSQRQKSTFFKKILNFQKQVVPMMIRRIEQKGYGKSYSMTHNELKHQKKFQICSGG